MNPYNSGWESSPAPNSLPAYVEQLTSQRNTDEQIKQNWKKIKNKKVEASGVVVDVRKINWKQIENSWDGSGLMYSDLTTGWEVITKDPQVKSDLTISLVCHNCDIAKSLQKGQVFNFGGELWRFHGHTLYLSPVRFDIPGFYKN